MHRRSIARRPAIWARLFIMPVTTIILLRHGHRLAWTLDPSTGKYTSNHPYPTRLPADPPLASHGVSQAQETGAHLGELLLPLAREGRLRIYSSLFYRCIETLRPTVEALNAELEPEKQIRVRGERGLGEWFGKAWFEQPVPASPVVLRDGWFPWVDGAYESLVVPHSKGERIVELHERVRDALEAVVQNVDQEDPDKPITILICGHAAQVIATGRALTGRVPEDLDEDDFQCFTCGLSKFERRSGENGGEGVGGGFNCVMNSDCEHLSTGEERGWRFQGDESFDSYEACQGRGPEEYGGSRSSGGAKL